MQEVLQAVVWTAVLTIVVMILAVLTRLKLINKINKVLAALAVLAIAICQTYPRVFALWGSFGPDWLAMLLSWVATIFMTLWTTVFTFGGMILASQPIDKEGNIQIIESSALYHVLKNYCGLDPTRTNNLCNLSWLGVIAIASQTLLQVFIYGVVIIVSVLVWLIHGVNPIQYGRKVTTEGRLYTPKVVKRWGLPFTPLLIGVIPCVVYGLCGLAVTFPFIRQGLMVLGSIIIVMLIYVYVDCWLTHVILRRNRAVVLTQEPRQIIVAPVSAVEVKERQPSLLSLFWAKLASSWHESLQAVAGHCNLLLKLTFSFKKRICPPVIVIKSDE